MYDEAVRKYTNDHAVNLVAPQAPAKMNEAYAKLDSKAYVQTGLEEKVLKNFSKDYQRLSIHAPSFGVLRPERSKILTHTWR